VGKQWPGLLRVGYRDLLRKNNRIQCGFRKGRDCTEMTFTVSQLLEKAVEHRTKKAYNSVSEEGLWIVLRKLGVSEASSDHFMTTWKQEFLCWKRLIYKVNNGLYNGTYSVLTSCMCSSGWRDSSSGKVVGGIEEVGTCVLYKLDNPLFRRNIRGASSDNILNWMANCRTKSQSTGSFQHETITPPSASVGSFSSCRMSIPAQ